MRMSLAIKQFFIKLFILFFWMITFWFILYMPNILVFKTNDRIINVATWTDMIDETVLEQFYEKTGITVNMSYFDNNDELLVKMRATKGEGYDLIIPTDYAVQQLINEDLLQPLDKKKFLHWQRINSRLLDCYFDPGNLFSIPYYWGIYGLGIDTEFFAHVPEPTWDLIFKQLSPKAKIAMLDTPREAILLTAQYLFKSIDNLTPEKKEAIKKLLIKQKEWVEAYTEFRADYLLISKTSPVVVTTTPFISRLINVQPNIEFIIPKEGSFMVTDNWVIPKISKKSELIYEFLNFLYQPEILEFHFNIFTFFPATVDLETLLQKNDKYSSIYRAHFEKKYVLDFFRNVISKTAINDIWISLKAS